ncbi:hypothetical protein ATHL_01349 [Anaerolinea thermolimosa]|uniref:hypothetical protein n=1 Tax=Anaerolinea thermolimosa TaxID=229919 RepID=UPI000781D3CF|nr:hypothetical protein [Anaerolinea thermolimosa]GAP06495.1 hypothetical protein ATHL_01349 [Anaerolinea thermolimosa]
MGITPLTLKPDYWKNFEITEEDLQFIYNHLLELETPLTAEELVETLVIERIRREKDNLLQQQNHSNQIYRPGEPYQIGQQLLFPAFNWKRGRVLSIREGNNPEISSFKVIEVEFENGERHLFASELPDHKLNTPIEISLDDPELDPKYVLKSHGQQLIKVLTQHLEGNPELVKIAGRWFPRALLVDINMGHLNLAEAILEVANGGPLPTHELMEQLDLPQDVNPKLTEFSLNLALQNDERFDEVGPAGKILWYLRRLEPEFVKQPPPQLTYTPYPYQPEKVAGLLAQFEGHIADELDQCIAPPATNDEVTITLLYPHFRVGALPVCGDLYRFFPTAYESPRVRFTFVDAETRAQFEGWVVREHGYVLGLREWFLKNECFPGSLITIRKSEVPGEVIVSSGHRRPTREWLRTAMVGSDGGIVFAMLKHNISTPYDERMAIVVPDQEALDKVWEQSNSRNRSLPQIVKKVMFELAKLSPQGHVHAQELYAAVNIIRRSPPGPIVSILLESEWAQHLGDLYFRFHDSNSTEG